MELETRDHEVEQDSFREIGADLGAARLEAACQKALLLERPHRSVVMNLLKHHQESIPSTAVEQDEQPVTHHNIRGQHYYQ